jgi:cytochrome c oxidase cbb3-type subunit 3
MSRMAALLSLAALVCGCQREAAMSRPAAPPTRADAVRLTSLQAGGRYDQPPADGGYKEDAYAIGEGKRLYSAYNCNGCHAMGGGAIGPALMDDKWIYGAAPAQIFSTIVQGRPNGMPSFAGKVPEHEVWQIVAYIRSMSGNVPKDIAPGRNDDLSAGKPEVRKEREQPVQTGHR